VKEKSGAPPAMSNKYRLAPCVCNAAQPTGCESDRSHSSSRASESTTTTTMQQYFPPPNQKKAKT
jgi:hypothetical protein